MGETKEVTHNNWNLPNADNPENEKEKLGNLGEIVVGQRIESFISEVSVVGLKYVVLTGAMYVRKAIWLLFVLGGLGFMIYQFYDRISYFISNPTTVKVTIKPVEELEFPTVTVCNENIVSKSLTDLLPGFTDLIEDIFPLWPDESFQPRFDAVPLLEENLQIEDWFDIWLRALPFYGGQWGACTFNGKGCNPTDIQIVSTEMGFCVQFNGDGSNFISTQPGYLQGFWMLVNIKQDDYLAASSRMAGVRVAVHEKHETPSFNQFSIKVGPGYVTSIGLNKRTIIDLPYPYTNCSDEEGYSTQKCLQRCYENYVMEECKCRIYYFESDDYISCDPEEMYICANPKSREFQNNNLANTLCNCSQQCETNKYAYVISTAPSSEQSLKQAAKEELEETLCNPDCNITDDMIKEYMEILRKDVIEIEVFFQDLKVEEVVTQKAYTTLALLCDIGGALGLILGATILTVFEIVDFLVILTYDFIRYKIAQRKNNRTAPEK